MKKLALLFACLLSAASLSFAQVTTVKGSVTSSEDGLGVIGASVFVK